MKKTLHSYLVKAHKIKVFSCRCCQYVYRKQFCGVKDGCTNHYTIICTKECVSSICWAMPQILGNSCGIKMKARFDVCRNGICLGDVRRKFVQSFEYKSLIVYIIHWSGVYFILKLYENPRTIIKVYVANSDFLSRFFKG